jgi:Asp-tRNA(Asn)/Glu-tRNA(Gln) amidotransferase A subunit family amidase
MELWQLDATQAAALIDHGTLTSERYVAALLERIAQREPLVRAWVTVDAEQALAQARSRDREPRRGLLHGIPVGVKDVINTRDLPTQHNSPIYQGHQPTEDANCVGVLRAAGAVILGKTETLEFASGGRMPPTRNPHDTERTPGGSSSGSGAAVAVGMVPLALATQTGGSTIRPASFCGAYGMKPTFGRIGFEGAKHYSPHLDTIGLMARSARDLGLLGRVFNLATEEELRPASIAGLRLALCETPMWHEADEDAQQALHEAARRLAEAGAQVAPLVLSEPFRFLTQQQDDIMQDGGRGAFLPEYLAHPDLLHDDFKRKVQNQFGFTGAHLRAAFDQAALRRIDFEREMGDFDAVLTLSAPGIAPLGIASQGMATFNRIWTVLHVPAISIPGMRGRHGMPIGMQLIQRRYEDARLLQVAAVVAAVLDPQRPDNTQGEKGAP